MLKIIGATLAVAVVTGAAAQALALNPQPLPPRVLPQYHVTHITPPCPPSRNPNVRTCV